MYAFSYWSNPSFPPFEEEIDPWTSFISIQGDKILQALQAMENHDESEAKQEAFEKFLPVFLIMWTLICFIRMKLQ